MRLSDWLASTCTISRSASRFGTGRRGPLRRSSTRTAAVLERLEDRTLLSATGTSDRSSDFSQLSFTPLVSLPPSISAGAIYAASTAPVAAPVAAPPFPLGQTFLLNSLPGANLTIYLDFDGHTTTGTQWNASFNNGTAIVSPAWDPSGDGAAFNSAELEGIQRIWQRVAEDFRPFNVNVTTQDPGVERLRRTGTGDTEWGVRSIQTLDQSWLRDDVGFAVGGIAYLNSFASSVDVPCFTFNGSNSLSLGAESAAADTHSHEVGHTLGLGHDGLFPNSDPRHVEYYGGHGNGPTGWAPIMGAGFGQALSQWDKGEYANASNNQDDLSVIADTGRNNPGYRIDDHGNSNGTASVLSVNGVSIVGSGIIERTADVDVFALDLGAGQLTINVDPWERGPNLDILAELYNSTGTLVSSSNPADALNGTVSTTVLTAGRYYLRVDGVGRAAVGNDQGYSDYASLGAYTIAGTLDPPPGINVTTSTAGVLEDGNSQMTFFFTRGGDTSQAVFANFSMASVATLGTDFTVVGASNFDDVTRTGTVFFGAGSNVAQLVIDPTDDSTVELDETVTVTLTSGLGYVLGSGVVAVGTIKNDDTATITVADRFVTEGDAGSQFVTFTLQLGGAVDVPVTINFDTENASATAGTDYRATSGSRTFNSGETTKTIKVEVFGDLVVETNENFLLRLSNLSASGRAVTLPRDSASLAITDDDAASLTLTDASITEGNNGTSLLKFDVVLNTAVDGGFRVEYLSTPGSAFAGVDYELTSGELNFTGAAGEIQQIAVTVRGDDVVEMDETIGMRLRNLITGGRNVSLGRSNAIGTIENDDSAVVTVSNVSRIEGNDGTSQLLFSVALSHAVDRSISIDFATANGTASAGSDYIETSGTMTIPVGALQAVLPVVVKGDRSVEADETFAMLLSNLAASGRNVTLQTASATGTILNDDLYLLSVNSPTVFEGNDGPRQVDFTVTLNQPASAPFSVAYATANGTATSDDYVAQSGTINFTADDVTQGTLTKTVSITVNGDLVQEQNETIRLVLGEILGGGGKVQVTAGVGVLTLKNDDFAAVNIADAVVTEGDDGTTVARVAVRLTRPLDREMSVVYRTFDRSALAGSDYTGKAGRLVFAKGETEKTIEIEVRGNRVAERLESLGIRLSDLVVSGLPVMVGRSDAMVTINDNDTATLSVSDVTVREGQEGSREVFFRVTLTGAVDAPFTVNYATGDGTASSIAVPSPDITNASLADFRRTNGRLTFQGTDGEVQTFSVTVFGDTLLERNESFSVRLFELAAGGRSLGIAKGTGTATLLNDETFVAVTAGTETSIKLLSGPENTVLRTIEAFGPGLMGGIQITTGDINGDGVADIITTPRDPRAASAIRVFDGLTGTLLKSFFAFSDGYRGGVNIAAGDMNGDGKDDIVTAVASNAGPHVIVYDAVTEAVIRSQFVFEPDFGFGVKVAVGDYNGDGTADLIVAPNDPAGGTQVRVIDGRNRAVLADFIAFAGFGGGINISAGDVDGDGADDIVVGVASLAGPHVKVFTRGGADPIISRFVFNSDGNALRGGVNVSAGDLDGDGRADIVAGLATSLPPLMTAISGRTGQPIRSYLAGEPNDIRGVVVAAGVSARSKLPRLELSTVAGRLAALDLAFQTGKLQESLLV